MCQLELLLKLWIFHLQIWRVSGGEKQPLSLDQFGHFQSDLTYLIQYNYQKQSSLYVWMESMLFVWVGGGVGSAEGEVREALNGAKELDTCGKMVRLKHPPKQYDIHTPIH